MGWEKQLPLKWWTKEDGSEANRTGQSNESTGSHPLWKELEGGRLDEGVDWHELKCPDGWAVRK